LRWVVQRRILQLVAQEGIPTRDEFSDESTYQRVRHDWLKVLFVIAVTHTDTSVRIASMQALAAVSGAEVDSLREEDWQSWWLEQKDAALARQEARRSSEGGAP